MLAPMPTQFVDADRSLSTLTCLKDAGATVQVTITPVNYSFINLPPELWTAIFLQTDGRTILRCCAVCHRFNDIIQASVELQYQIELTLDGMIDGPPSSLTVGDRLTRLRALRQSWAMLQWTSKITVPMPGPCHAYELVGGVFCKIYHSARHRFSSRHFTAAWLPSVLDPQSSTLVRGDVGLPTRDFAVDPSQDLIIYFRGDDAEALPPLVAPGVLELHVRTLSTNEVHPEARLPTLCTSVLLPITNAFMQIVDDIVGMLYFIEPERPHITIWNWKTGKVVVLYCLVYEANLHCVQNQSTFHIPPNTWDFSFISSRAFFVTTIQTYGTIDIFTFDDDTTEPDQSDSHPPSSSPSSSEEHESTAYKFITPPESNVTHVASLHLPTTLPHIRVMNLSTHTGPFLARPPSGRPFVAANEERTHVFSVQYVNPSPDAPRRQIRFCVFLKNSTLEGFIPKYHSRSSVGRETLATPLVVPWEEWGRENTRFMVHHWNQFEWMRYVHGHRVVLPAPRNGRAMIYVLDFNVRNTVRQNQYYLLDNQPPTEELQRKAFSKQFAMLQHLKEHGAIPNHAGLITKPSEEFHPLFFPAPFETALPYRELWHEQEVGYSGIMVDEERLVCLEYPAFSNGDMKDIHVLTM
ncbi:hypothetical protein EDC04DRAFT_3068226 [Pisolithus marmoratus]|nr:hypothetical protein EDC04DRAFT_3068226 [Pisolithus marmoratus]